MDEPYYKIEYVVNRKAPTEAGAQSEVDPAGAWDAGTWRIWVLMLALPARGGGRAAAGTEDG